ncbi:MAG: serine hydrolase domain-containing protein [Gemmatimonadaceae bacterium]
MRVAPPVAAVALSLLIAAPALAAQSTVSLAFRDSLPSWLAATHVPGIAVAVIENGKVTTTLTSGELRPGIPMSRRALFNVASLTKPVVAITTLRLANAGKLSLDEPLDPDWIDPDVRNDPRHSKLTARLVLTHQTGFPNWRRLMPDHKLGFLSDPGTKFGYSGEGLEYLRHALEHEFGRSLQQLSDSILFTPLGMTATTYGWNSTQDTLRFAVGHDTIGAMIHEPLRPMSQPSGADWLVTTIGDYSRFGEFVLSGAGLSPALFADMTSPHAQFEGKPNEAMGLGWEVMKGPAGDPTILMHTGSDAGIKTMILLLPASRRGIVIFTNGERGMEVIVHILHSALQMKELGS